MTRLKTIFDECIRAINLNEVFGKMISVVLTIVVFFILARAAQRFIRHIFSNKNKLKPHLNEKRNLTLQKTFSSLISWIIWTLCLLVVLSFFIDIGALLAVAGVGTIAVGFAAQSIVEDLMSGLMIIIEDQFNVGDYVTVADRYGVVERIGVRTTSIRQLDGGLFSIYNGQIKQSINYSKGSIVAPAEFKIGLQEDIDRAMEILKEGCKTIYAKQGSLFVKEPQVIGVTEMSPTAFTVRVIGSVAAPSKAQASSILFSTLNEMLEKNGIRMPFNKIQVLDPNKTQEVRLA